MAKRYACVQGHIIGNPCDWQMCWHADTRRFQSWKAAFAAGVRAFESDDFIIAVLENDRLVSTQWAGEPREDDPDELAEIADALAVTVKNGAGNG